MLIKAHQKLVNLKYDIKIVPVCVNYDRLFDQSYLATEMISGKFQNINMTQLLKKIYDMRKGKLGKVFVKYGEPIDLTTYIEKHNGSKESVSLTLTRDLYKIHQQE